MSEPAPWGQWDTFSEVQGNSASLSFNESPTVVNVDAQPQTRSVVSDFSSSNSSGSGCTSCQQNTYQPQKTTNVNKGVSHHPFPPKEEEEEKPLESVGFIVNSQLRGIGNEINHLEDLSKSNNSQKKVSAFAHDIEKAITQLSQNVKVYHKDAYDARDTLESLESGSQKVYNLCKLNDTLCQVNQSNDIRRLLMVNSIFLPLIFLGGIFYLQKDSDKNDMILGAGALCLLLLIFILRTGD
jgi:hypothetical protein